MHGKSWYVLSPEGEEMWDRDRAYQRFRALRREGRAPLALVERRHHRGELVSERTLLREKGGRE